VSFTRAEIVDVYPDLEAEDVREAILYSAEGAHPGVETNLCDTREIN
jgi:uncharacterized protein (DUF433 family)